MNIGIVTTWFERGAAYVSRAYMDTLSKEHNVFIYARGGEEYANGDPDWDLPNVTWGEKLENINQKTYIIWEDFLLWLNSYNIDIVIFNEQNSWDIILKLRNKQILIGAYIDYYTPKTVPLFNFYDFLLCNTKRHYNVFKCHQQCFYIPWGTDTNLCAPKEKQSFKKKIVFFHSAGMGGTNLRKGTDILVKAFKEVRGDVRLIIHSQVNLDKYKPVANLIKNDNRIEFIEGTFSLPGLYHKGDVYVYPTRLEGIGLSIAEALSCGLPVITTDNPPMNEFVQHGKSGYLVDVEEFKKRKDGYYWPESICSEESLRRAMQRYVDNPEIIEKQSQQAREYALNHLTWKDNSKSLGQLVRSLKRVRTWTKQDVETIKNFSEQTNLYIKLIRYHISNKDRNKSLKYFVKMILIQPRNLFKRKTWSIAKIILKQYWKSV
jgi:1,2-diacylglycerol 3-alpha-glucosyltransferase